jgi:DNA-binding HxlR family transcriptional regulator
VPFASCPINATLGTLGRKWTLPILRDIAFQPGVGFNALLRANPGLRQRTLSLRLLQLVDEGLVHKTLVVNGGRRAHYALTAKGREVWPVLAALLQFGVRNHADRVFADGQARDIDDLYPDSADLMLDHLAEYARGSPRRRNGHRLPAESEAPAKGTREPRPA